MNRLGIKANMPDILASLLSKQIKNVYKNLKLREKAYNYYNKLLVGSDIIIPKINKNGEKEKTLTNSNWKDIEFKNFQNYLESKNIKNKEIIEKKKNIFKEKMEEWTKKNLKQIFENQINLKSKELIAEKLK